MQTSTRRRLATSSLLTAVLVGLVAAATALAAAPRSTSPPTLEGTFRQGETVRTSNGLWANDPTSFSYRWFRCDANAGTNCVAISGATSNTYRLVKADVGHSVLTRVTARNADGSATANSKPSPVVADNKAPSNTAAPTIGGSAVVGEQLTANEGAWTGAPDRYLYQWQQCDAAGAACAPISGATGKIYGVRSADLGRTLRVAVTAVNPNGRTTAVSAQTGIVRGAGAGGGTAVSVASVSLPDRLVFSSTSFSPSAIRNRFDTMTLRVRVSDTRGRLVSGALVYATGVPFGRITAMPEVATNSSGVATLTFRPTARLPIVRNTAVQIFLRVRKPGENPLAGVSNRRLIQVRIVPG